MTNTTKRGFTAMNGDRQKEMATKEGHATVQEAGHQGMSEIGRTGGNARKRTTNYSEMGKQRGKFSSKER